MAGAVSWGTRQRMEQSAGGYTPALKGEEVDSYKHLSLYLTCLRYCQKPPLGNSGAGNESA